MLWAEALLVSAVAPARGQAQPHLQKLAFVPIEKRTDPETHFLCFALLDDDRTDPESQIVVSLSAMPADSEDIELRVWLVDSAGGEVKVSGMDQDSIVPWEFRIKEDSGYYIVQWENLRPQFPGRGIYRLRASLTTPTKPKQSQRFVLQRTGCK